MQRKFTKAFYVPGTGVDWNLRFIVASACSLVHVSAVSSAAQNGTFTIGDGSDLDEHLTASAIGDSDVPNEFDGDDFVDSAGDTHTRHYPHIAAGATVNVAVDTDGGVSGTADDTCIVLTFVEG